MISADAVRPGDVLIASNGKTIEVLKGFVATGLVQLLLQVANTDAEGRLTLADALGL